MMDEDRHEPLKTTRLLAWLAAGLLAAGVVTVGLATDRNEAENGRVVAAGQSADAFAPLPPAAEPPPPTVAAPTTIAASKPTPTAPPTTQPTRTTTTKPAVTLTSTTTAVASAPSAPAGPVFSVTVNVVNEHPQAMHIRVNGKTFTLSPGQQSGPVMIVRYDHGNDIVEASTVQEPTCGMGDADGYFPTPGSYRLAVVAGRGLCPNGVPGPLVTVTPA